MSERKAREFWIKYRNDFKEVLNYEPNHFHSCTNEYIHVREVIPNDEIEATKNQIVGLQGGYNWVLDENSSLISRNIELQEKLDIARHSISLAIGEFLGDEEKALSLDKALQKLNEIK